MAVAQLTQAGGGFFVIADWLIGRAFGSTVAPIKALVAAQNAHYGKENP